MQSKTKLICFFLVVVGATAEPTKDEKFQVASYGPDNCIQTYLSESGTCIVETKCKEDSLNKVNMGLVCADKKGDMARHVFGVDSFGHSEKFDTLIPCNQCLAIDNFDSGKDTEEAVLKDEVETLKGDVKSLGMRVTKLEGGAEKAAEDATDDKKPDEKKEEKADHSLMSGGSESTTASEDEGSEDEEQEGEEEAEEDAPVKALKKAHVALRGGQKKQHLAKKSGKKHQKAKKHRRRAHQKKEEDDENDSDDDEDDEGEEEEEDEEQADDDKLDSEDI